MGGMNINGLPFINGPCTASLHIEDEVWIGLGSVILQGVTMVKGIIIAAGSVVHRNVSPGEMHGERVAKFIQTIEG